MRWVKQNRIVLHFACGCLLLVSCGGDQNGPPPPAPVPEFSLSVSPRSTSAPVGDTTSAVTLVAAAENGFSDMIDVSVEGLPAGMVSFPASGSLQVGVKQAFTFTVSGSAAPGTFPIKLVGRSGKLSHSAQVLVTVEPLVSISTYQSGSVLYIESRAGADVARLGLETQWGGSIVEVSLNGTNFVNLHDTGREVQAAQWDGNAQYDACAGCTGTFGWNPVQAGDEYNHGSPLLAHTLSPDSLYIKAQGYQWNPNDKGGGPGQAVLGDTYVEATISAVIRHANSFKVHYKVTHFGADQHANSTQEFPAVYVNLGYDRFVTYQNTAPWTNDAVSDTALPQLPNFSPHYYAPEQWAALVDKGDFGLAVFVPGVAPYTGGFASAGDPGPAGSGTNYFTPFATYSFGPNSVLEGDVYLLAGDYKHARQVVYDLHNQLSAVDIFAPFGVVDAPTASSQLAGAATISGWAFDDQAVSKVEVFVDGVVAGTANYGESRPDVAHDFPHVSTAIGYSFSLDTLRYGNGAHTIEVRAVDASGNPAVFPRVPVLIQN